MGEREGGKEGENKRQKSLKLNCSISDVNTFDLKDCVTINAHVPPHLNAEQVKQENCFYPDHSQFYFYHNFP